MSIDLRFVDETLERVGRKPEAVIPVLQAMQDHYGYLPGEALLKICGESEITPASMAGVSSFYDMFRHQPVGKFMVRVCRGTACHVTGAERIEDALRRQLHIPAGQDTDPEGKFTIEQVACLGCCTLAPVVKIEQSTFGHVTIDKVPRIISDFESWQDKGSPTRSTEEPGQATNGHPQINIGLGSCCMAKGSDELFHALNDSVRQNKAKVVVRRVGCVGMCHRTPMIEVVLPGKTNRFYAGLNPSEAGNLVQRFFHRPSLLQRVGQAWRRTLDGWLWEEPESPIDQCELSIREPEVSAFLSKQIHVATEHFGKVDPLDLDEYVARGGFQGLARCLALTRFENSSSRPKSTEGQDATEPVAEALSPDQIITILEKSGLRGRGGAGFPTGAKWRLASQQASEAKYVICNGDEGDPGAFMDRMLLESFPYRLIEGLAVAAVAVGAHEGIFYIRHEYPLAVQRVRSAIKLCQQRGWLGERLLGSTYQLNLSIKEGAGAFVCGEETALIASIEGRRGMPRLRPPFPVQEGLWGKPTVINNVETLATIPWILQHGPEAFAKFGTPSSKGTKVFALAGNVQRGGLIEIPMGTTIREIVEEIGGGVKAGRRFKAVQIGGPSGGCIPARLADTSVDYESLRDVGAIMGSGGLVVLDDTACMVDIARYFLQFTQEQSCGKCTFCRIGTKRMLDILERLCQGKGQRQDITELERLAKQVGTGSLCGLGKTAPNPILTTLRYFREEYEAHLQGKCPAGRCSALIHYQVKDNCTGCTLCAQVCPVKAIPMVPYARHVINSDLCTRCDACRQQCPQDAIEVK